MSVLLDRIDAGEIFAAASVDAISLKEARNQLQSYSAVDRIIEGLDQRFTDAIAAEGCATPRLFLERTFARLPPTLGSVYSAEMIACDEAFVRCEKQSPEGTLSVALVFWFRARSYYAARQVFAMFNRRFDSRPIEEHFGLLRADPAQTASRLPLLPLILLPTRRARKPLFDHSSRSLLRVLRLQAQLMSCSVCRPLTLHLSRSSRRQEPIPRLTRVIRGLHCRSRIG